MKKHLIMGISILLALLCTVSIFARDSEGRKDTWSTKSGCDRLENLGLSKNQLEAVRKAEAIYSEPIFRLRKAMMFKHIELRDLLQDPQSSEEAIRSKAREIENLQKKMRQNMIDYQIALRRILTPAQIRRWCTLARGGFQSGRENRWPK